MVAKKRPSDLVEIETDSDDDIPKAKKARTEPSIVKAPLGLTNSNVPSPVRSMARPKVPAQVTSQNAAFRPPMAARTLAQSLTQSIQPPVAGPSRPAPPVYLPNDAMSAAMLLAGGMGADTDDEMSDGENPFLRHSSLNPIRPAAFHVDKTQFVLLAHPFA